MQRLKMAIIYPNPIPFRGLDYQKGLAGTEGAVVNYSRSIAKYQHDVTVYNYCTHPGIYFNVQWRHIDSINIDESVDVAIYVKSLGESHRRLKARWNSLMLTDRVMPTDLNEWIEKSEIDSIICTSQYQYNLASDKLKSEEKLYLGGLGICVDDFKPTESKEDGLCIFTSVPYRGLDILLNLWPEIYKSESKAKLNIVSSYLIWKQSNDENLTKMQYYNDQIDEMNGQNVYNLLRERIEPYSYHEIVALQQKAELFLYPSTYDDSFCVAALEAAAAGTVIVTSARAALKERVIHGVTGFLVEGHPESETYNREFLYYTLKLLNDKELLRKMSHQSIEFAKSNDIDILTRDLLIYFISNLKIK